MKIRKQNLKWFVQPAGSESDDDHGGHSRSRKRRHRTSRSPSNTSRAGSMDSSDSQYSSVRKTRHKKSKRKKARSRSVSLTTFYGKMDSKNTFQNKGSLGIFVNLLWREMCWFSFWIRPLKFLFSCIFVLFF